MEYKEAIEILKEMLNKDLFNAKERNAIITAIGALSWGVLARNKLRGMIKAKKEKKRRDIEG